MSSFLKISNIPDRGHSVRHNPTVKITWNRIILITEHEQKISLCVLAAAAQLVGALKGLQTESSTV